MFVQHIEVSKGSQDIRYTELLTSGGYQLRIDIRRDSHINQSHAHIDVFSRDALKWNRLADIQPPLIETKTRLEACNNDFKDDRQTLLIKAINILQITEKP